MKNTLASAFLAIGVIGLLGSPGHAANFPQAALAGAPMAHSANRAPVVAQALRTGFPTLVPVGASVSGADRPSHDLHAGGIEFPGVVASPRRAQAAPVEAAAGRDTLQANRFQTISLR